MNEREEIRRELALAGITDPTEDDIDLVIVLATQGVFDPKDN